MKIGGNMHLSILHLLIFFYVLKKYQFGTLYWQMLKIKSDRGQANVIGTSPVFSNRNPSKHEGRTHNKPHWKISYLHGCECRPTVIHVLPVLNVLHRDQHVHLVLKTKMLFRNNFANLLLAIGLITHYFNRQSVC